MVPHSKVGKTLGWWGSNPEPLNLRYAFLLLDQFIRFVWLFLLVRKAVLISQNLTFNISLFGGLAKEN